MFWDPYMILISIKAIIIVIKSKNPNLIICLEAHGLQDPPAAEYNPAAPIKEIKVIKKIKR